MDSEKKKALEDAVADALAKTVANGEATQAALYARVLEAVAGLPVECTQTPAGIKSPPMPPEVAAYYQKRAESDAKYMGLNSVARGGCTCKAARLNAQCECGKASRTSAGRKRSNRK